MGGMGGGEWDRKTIERPRTWMVGGSLPQCVHGGPRAAQLWPHPAGRQAAPGPDTRAQYSYPLVSWMLTPRESVHRNLQRVGRSEASLVRVGQVQVLGQHTARFAKLTWQGLGGEAVQAAQHSVPRCCPIAASCPLGPAPNVADGTEAGAAVCDSWRGTGAQQ